MTCTRLEGCDDYLRPWKLVTFSIGLALLMAGAVTDQAPDWDIPISVIMALLAYLTAPWSLHVLLEHRWSRLPVAVFFTWFTVDGCYALYWYFRNPVVLDLMRSANWPASLSLYGLCALIWYPRCALKDLPSRLMKIGKRCSGEPNRGDHARIRHLDR